MRSVAGWRIVLPKIKVNYLPVARVTTYRWNLRIFLSNSCFRRSGFSCIVSWCYDHDENPMSMLSMNSGVLILKLEGPGLGDERTLYMLRVCDFQAYAWRSSAAFCVHVLGAHDFGSAAVTKQDRTITYYSISTRLNSGVSSLCIAVEMQEMTGEGPVMV